MKITVYLTENASRVVAGDHKAHEGSKGWTVHVYPSSELAYGAESRPEVRKAIALIDPGVERKWIDSHGLPPIRKVSIPAGNLCPGGGASPVMRQTGIVCPVCGESFLIEQLRGSDNRLPSHKRAWA